MIVIDDNRQFIYSYLARIVDLRIIVLTSVKIATRAEGAYALVKQTFKSKKVSYFTREALRKRVLQLNSSGNQ